MTGSLPKAFVFDLDGTVYLGDEALPGAAETLQWVRSIGGAVRFVTNNPRYSRGYYASKLTHLGLRADVDEILTSGVLMAEYLKDKWADARLYVIGEEQLKRELTGAGLQLVDTDSGVDIVIASFDTTFSYDKLLYAYRALQRGARFFATNPDVVCPTPDGGLPDAGSIIGALEQCTGRSVELVVGKPSPQLAKILLDEFAVPAEQCIVVGDRLATDIQLGNAAGMQTAWIRPFGGVEKASATRDITPSYILDSIADLPHCFEARLMG